MNPIRRTAIALAISCMGVSTAHATNGINLIGFGAESTLMGGADVAVARDTSALNTNPAGLTQIKAPLADIFGSMLRTTDLVHKDSNGNQEHASNRYTFLAGGGYAQPIENTACTAGVGLFAQGGAGGVFENIRTPFGGRDDLSSLFGIAKIIPGIGCQVTENLSLGASLNIVYASIEQDFFGNTSFQSGPVSFAGYKLEDAAALRTGFKLGAQYRVSPALTFAATYTEKTELPMTGGSLVADFTAQGLGKVKYSDATVKGFALPREVALGVAFKPTEALLLSFKVNWLNWDDAIDTVTVRGTDRNNASAPAEYTLVAPADWKDQWVIATGLAYNWDDRTTLYAGHNYGQNPIPRKNSSPLLAGILEHHLTFGAAHKIDQNWTMTGGVEWMLPVGERYTNPLFGEAEIRNEAIFFHMMLSRRW
jgi:long-chain fatty acid transport protein